MKQSFGQKGAGGRFLALALALIMLCSVLAPAYAAAVDEQGAAENQNEPVPVGVTYIFYVGETEYRRVKVLSGSVLTKPEDPTSEEGMVFVCWQLADGQEFTSFETAVSTPQDETVKLYARFAPAAPANELPAGESPAQQPETPKPDAAQQPDPGATEDGQTPTGGENQNGNTENQPGENPAENNENQTPGEPNGDENITPSEPTAPTDPVTPAEPVAPAEPQPAEETPIVPPAETVDPAALFAEILACEDPEMLEQLLAQAADSAEFETYLESLSEDELIAYNEKLSLLTGGENELAAYAFNGDVTSVKISDTILSDGQLNLVVNGDKTITAESLVAAGYQIEWMRGTSTVERRVVTTLSDGTDCYNMDASGQWVNVAYDRGASMPYTVTVSKDGVTIVSDSYTVPYFDKIQNGSFEQPVLTEGMQLQTTYEANPSICWKTTADDRLIEIVSTSTERESNGQTYKSLAGKYHNMDRAQDGIQYAEINAEATGALYQDVLTEPTAEMNWQVYHNGRDGTDTMAVVIMATKDAENIKTQQQLLQAIKDIKEGKYTGAVVYDNLKGYQNSWTKHSNKYTVPEGQYLTRYFFVAIDTAATGDKKDTIGNHIDNVWFSTETPPPVESEGTLTIEKYVYGLTLQEAQSLADGFISYQEENSKEWTNVSFENEDWKAGYDESGAACIIGRVEIPVTGLGSKSYTVKEDADKAKLDGYALQTDEQSQQSVTLTKSENVQTVKFKNHYTPSTQDLVIKKIVNGNMVDENKEFQFTYTYKVGNRTVNENFELKGGQTYTISGIPVGTEVTVTENETGYDTSYSYKLAPESEGETPETVTVDERICKFTVRADKYNEITFTNSKFQIPDTGVLLDSLPYVLILAVVAAGAVLTIARRRRDAD